jgi:O-antigen/teichoic acid export membrane protein
VLGYVITWWVAREIGFASYATFATFWAFLYLLVGSLSGFQQEFTRATRPVAHTAERRANRFALIASALIFVIVAATSPLWVDHLFPLEHYALVWPLALGTASYVLVAILSGVLYGTSRWRPLAAMIVIDPVLRLSALVVALLFTRDIAVLAWAVALPLPLTFTVVWSVIRRQLAGRFVVDVGYRQLSWNALRIVVAAAALSLMVSGFPLVLGATSKSDPRAAVGLLILAITLTRAPLIVTVMSLQGLLIVRFRDHAATFAKTLFALLGFVLGVAAILAVLGWTAGPPVFSFLFPNEVTPPGWLLAVLVGSSALVAAMCVTASATLARSQHFFYSIGWVSAAIITVIALLLPMGLVPRTLLALVAGPIAGLVVHGFGLAVGWRTPHEEHDLVVGV